MILRTENILSMILVHKPTRGYGAVAYTLFIVTDRKYLWKRGVCSSKFNPIASFVSIE